MTPNGDSGKGSVLNVFCPNLVNKACMQPVRLFAAVALAATFVFAPQSARSEVLELDHPCAELVKKYLTSVVSQDWTTAAALLLPSSLERKQKETVAIIKTAPTMSEESAMLERFGVKDLRELEKMTPQEFYIADRVAWHDRINASDEVMERKKETLKIDVLCLVEEKDKGYVHATVRTSQETLTDRIEELFLISFILKDGSKTEWLIWPELKDRPIITPLEGAKDGEKKGE